MCMIFMHVVCVCMCVSAHHMYRDQKTRIWGVCSLTFSGVLKTELRLLGLYEKFP